MIQIDRGPGPCYGDGLSRRGFDEIVRDLSRPAAASSAESWPGSGNTSAGCKTSKARREDLR
jgi:hypothetical protein